MPPVTVAEIDARLRQLPPEKLAVVYDFVSYLLERDAAELLATDDDVILCQITSRTVVDRYAVPLLESDFTTGGLRQASNIRPNRLFTAEGSIILYHAGTINHSKMQSVFR